MSNGSHNHFTALLRATFELGARCTFLNGKISFQDMSLYFSYQIISVTCPTLFRLLKAQPRADVRFERVIGSVITPDLHISKEIFYALFLWLHCGDIPKLSIENRMHLMTLAVCLKLKELGEQLLYEFEPLPPPEKKPPEVPAQPPTPKLEHKPLPKPKTAPVPAAAAAAAAAPTPAAVDTPAAEAAAASPPKPTPASSAQDKPTQKAHTRTLKRALRPSSAAASPSAAQPAAAVAPARPTTRPTPRTSLLARRSGPAIAKLKEIQPPEASPPKLIEPPGLFSAAAAEEMHVEPEYSLQEFDLDDDVPCSVCLSPAWTDDNPIVICEGCGVAAHKQCLAIPDRFLDDTTDLDWYCEACVARNAATAEGRPWDASAVRCVLCGHGLQFPVHQHGEASVTRFPTNMTLLEAPNKWVHTACYAALAQSDFHGTVPLDPNAVKQELRSCALSSIAKEQDPCAICRSSFGYRRKCLAEDCAQVYHPLCAAYAGAKAMGSGVPSFIAYKGFGVDSGRHIIEIDDDDERFLWEPSQAPLRLIVPFCATHCRFSLAHLQMREPSHATGGASEETCPEVLQMYKAWEEGTRARSPIAPKPLLARIKGGHHAAPTPESKPPSAHRSVTTPPPLVTELEHPPAAEPLTLYTLPDDEYFRKNPELLNFWTIVNIAPCDVIAIPHSELCSLVSGKYKISLRAAARGASVRRVELGEFLSTERFEERRERALALLISYASDHALIQLLCKEGWAAFARNLNAQRTSLSAMGSILPLAKPDSGVAAPFSILSKTILLVFDRDAPPPEPQQHAYIERRLRARGFTARVVRIGAARVSCVPETAHTVVVDEPTGGTEGTVALDDIRYGAGLGPIGWEPHAPPGASELLQEALMVAQYFACRWQRDIIGGVLVCTRREDARAGIAGLLHLVEASTASVLVEFLSSRLIPR
eukprot:gnl/Chilomastix_cuspidata/3323.p1 GENE.gnl/Chilomastix_cuspidata/3323~~gnl/Chilomastix_cuspidata/3323.p1  ORF type:complete len:932 (+),score=288.95 gnl/Chilomastix_cuspidata/3323:32-2827(+)